RSRKESGSALPSPWQAGAKAKAAPEPARLPKNCARFLPKRAPAHRPRGSATPGGARRQRPAAVNEVGTPSSPPARPPTRLSRSSGYTGRFPRPPDNRETVMSDTKILLAESDIPTHWYNVIADMPNPPAPPLGPDGRPVRPEALGAIFPEALIGQEVSRERWIPIPEAVREIYRLW